MFIFLCLCYNSFTNCKHKFDLPLGCRISVHRAVAGSVNAILFWRGPDVRNKREFSEVKAGNIKQRILSNE